MKTEKQVKDYIKKILTGSDAWYFMPVSAGYGKHGVPDFVGCHRGRFFAIEAKKPNRRLEEHRGASALQVRQMHLIETAGGMSMIFDGEDDDVTKLVAWLNDA